MSADASSNTAGAEVRSKARLPTFKDKFISSTLYNPNDMSPSNISHGTLQRPVSGVDLLMNNILIENSSKKALEYKHI